MISLLCPSRGRPAQLAAMWRSAACNATTHDVELVARLDDDDPDLAAYGHTDVPALSFITGPRSLLSDCWNEAATAARGDILMHCGDDIRFRTHGWDRLIADAFPRDGVALVHGRDGFQDAALGTHGFVTRRWVDTVGYFVPPLFSSDYNDTWLNDVADRIGRRVYVPEVLTEHMHPAAGKGEWDRTHRERLERHAADDPAAIYVEHEPQRERDAERLRAVMAVPVP